MKTVEDKLYEYRNETLVKPDENHKNRTLEQAKEIFYKNSLNRTSSYFEFLYQQGLFIRKRWWVLQFFILLVLYFLLQKTHMDTLMQRRMGILSSVFIIVMVPELWKNRSSVSMEIEGASYYTLRQIYSARMLLFTAVDGVLLSLFAGIAVSTTAIGIKEIILQFFLPMTITCCICFRTLCSKFSSSEYIAVTMSIFWIALWQLLILQTSVYDTISMPVWIGVCTLTFLYFCYCVRRVLKSCGNYWEVTMKWN